MTLSTSIREWVKPTFDHPYTFDPNKMTPLGVDRRGRHWWIDPAHPQWGELAERGTFDENRVALPDLPIAEIDGVPGLYMAFDPFRPGTFAALTNLPDRKPIVPAPHRPVDRLGFVFLADRIPEKIVALEHPRTNATPNPLSPAGIAPTIKKPEPEARGAAAIIARLKKNGADVRLSTDREHVIVSVEGGRPGAGIVELLEASAPLLVAYLNGSSLTCQVTDHGKAGAPEAITLAVGGAAWCGACE